MTYIFIGYSSKDAKIAESIHSSLEEKGFRVWCDERSIESKWSRETALEIAYKADAFCMIWTKNAYKSRRVRYEWLVARAVGKLIVPCIFSSAPELPRPLMNLESVKYEDIGSGTKSLIKYLRKLRTFDISYDYSLLPSNSNIPLIPNPNFVDRKLDLIELFDKMLSDLDLIGASKVGLVGMPGIGKTQLAVEFAYRFSSQYPDGIYWIQAADTNEWAKQFAWISKNQLQLSILDGSNQDRDGSLIALQNYCRKHPSMLIIMDDVEDPNFLNNSKSLVSGPISEPLTPLSLGCNILFATREPFQLQGQRVSSQDVGVLSPESSYTLLTKGRKAASFEKQYIKDIGNAVGFLPLAVVLVSAYLKNSPSVSFQDYLNLLKNRLDAIEPAEMSSKQLATQLTGESIREPFVFVSMSYAKELNDVYQYGILNPIKANKLVSERIDRTAFTGDILERIKQRIEDSAIVIAEFSGANPNVYLEVGYAWGKGRPTILLVRAEENLEFNIRNQRCIRYEQITELERDLGKELVEFKDKGII